jgi:hypothetical protein
MGWIEQFGVVNVSVNLNRSHANMARFQSRWFFFRLLINKKSLSRLWLSLLLRELSSESKTSFTNYDKSIFGRASTWRLCVRLLAVKTCYKLFD